MRLSRLAIAAAAACILWTAPMAARADTNIGSLVCNVSSGFGYLIGSNRNVSCVFNRSNGTVERYTGQIRDWGFDLGYFHAGSIVWGVIAPGNDVAPGSLAAIIPAPAPAAPPASASRSTFCSAAMAARFRCSPCRSKAMSESAPMSVSRACRSPTDNNPYEAAAWTR